MFFNSEPEWVSRVKDFYKGFWTVLFLVVLTGLIKPEWVPGGTLGVVRTFSLQNLGVYLLILVFIKGWGNYFIFRALRKAGRKRKNQDEYLGFGEEFKSNIAAATLEEIEFRWFYAVILIWIVSFLDSLLGGGLQKISADLLGWYSGWLYTGVAWQISLVSILTSIIFALVHEKKVATLPAGIFLAFIVFNNGLAVGIGIHFLHNLLVEWNIEVDEQRRNTEN